MTRRSTIGLIVIIAISFAVGLLISDRINKRRAEKVVFNNIPIVDAALKDSSSAYYVNFSGIDKDLHLLPIAIMAEDTNQISMLDMVNNMDCYDNITGGRTSDEIVDFAGEKIIFFADMANTPYEACHNPDDLRDLTVKNAISLLQDKSTLPKILIVNDPLAAIYGMKDLEAMLEQSKSGIKAVSVVKSAVRCAVDCIDTLDTGSYAIGIVGSRETIESEGFQNALKDEIINRGITADIQIIAQNYAADSTKISYLDTASHVVTKWNVSLTAIDSIFINRKFTESGEQTELKAIIIANNEYYESAEEYSLQAKVPCQIIYPQRCASADCYRILREDSNLSMRITKKSHQIYYSVKDDATGTTQNVCINQL